MTRVPTSGSAPHIRIRIFLLAAAALLFAACAGSADPTDETSTSTNPSTTTTTAGPATSTTSPPETTTTAPPTPLEELGYPVSTDWVVTTVIADIDSATGGLAMDDAGNFYQADFGYTGHVGNTVWKVTPDGEITEWAADDGMESLTMTVRLDDGTIYQSSYGSNAVYEIAPDGAVSVIAEGIRAVRGPTGILVNDDGSLIVEGYNSNILHRIEPDGTVVDWVTHPGFNGINGIARGDDGTIYVVNHRDGGIFSVSADGSEVEELHKFPAPTSHGVYLDGSLFVTSRGAFVVFRYDIETGEVEIIAGNGEGGDVDGRGGEASFGRPNAIIVGTDGALYINHGSENANNPVTIRRISYEPQG